MFGGDGAAPSARFSLSPAHGDSPTARDRPNPTTGALTVAGGARAATSHSASFWPNCRQTTLESPRASGDRERLRGRFGTIPGCEAISVSQKKQKSGARDYAVASKDLTKRPAVSM